MHFLRKLGRTLRVCYGMTCARMFGEYRHSEYACGYVHVYKYKGRIWTIPDGSISMEEYNA